MILALTVYIYVGFLEGKQQLQYCYGGTFVGSFGMAASLHFGIDTPAP